MLKKLKLRIFLLGLLVIVFQISVSPFIRIAGFGPDLIFVICLLLCMKFPVKYCFCIAFACGCVKELFVSHYFGLELIPYLVVGIFLPLLISRFNCENKLVRFSLIALLSFFMFTVNILCISLAENSFHILNGFYHKTIYSSCYSAIFAIFLGVIVDLFLPKKSIQYELF